VIEEGEQPPPSFPFDEIRRDTLKNLSDNFSKRKSTKTSFVGTEEYVSPEVLTKQAPTTACDLWSLGVIIYQMLTGKTPFKGKTTFFTFSNIVNGEFSFPPTFTEDASDLITRLLVLDPSKRLGAGEEGDGNDLTVL